MVEEFIHHSRDGFPLAVQTGGPTGPAQPENDGGPTTGSPGAPERGPGSPTLLLLPGQANSHHWWDTTRGAYEEAGFRTVTVDYRGTGGSRGELGDWTTDLFAEDALEALGIATAAVCGTSMGGRVAQMLAVRQPDRVSAVVLACTSPGGTHAVERKTETRRWLARGAREEQRAKLHELFYTPDWPGTPAQSTLLGDPTMSPREQVGHRRASDRHDAWDALPAITASTLVLHGTADLMVPTENAGLIAERSPGAGLRFYPGGRHGFFEEFAEQVVPDVLGFLAGLVPR